MKILVISLAGIGDTLFATPLIHELRAHHPEAQIDALVMWRGSKDILEGNRHLTTIYQKNLIKSGKLETWRFLQMLRKQRYDISFNTHPQSRIHYRIVARIINARIRASHEYENFGSLDRRLVNRTLPQNYNQHAIENNLALLKFLNDEPYVPKHGYELFLTAAENQWADEFIAKNNLAHRPIFAIHVGSGGTKNLALRRWPLGNYLVLIQQLNRELPEAAILLFGGPEEEKDHERIAAQTDPKHVFIVRSENLRYAAALLKKCDAFLSVDTALMHLAAAVHTPNQIVIETPTWNKPIEPRTESFTLIENPAVHGRNLEYYRYDGRDIQGSDEELVRCMKAVSVDTVFNVVREKIQGVHT